jgi:hypothetical protein
MNRSLLACLILFSLDTSVHALDKIRIGVPSVQAGALDIKRIRQASEFVSDFGIRILDLSRRLGADNKRKDSSLLRRK